VNQLPIVRVARVSSNILEPCPVCRTFQIGGEEFAASINHLIQHDYRLLHVGQESARDDNGALVQHTIAVLGTDQ
jgi:hypothetical protein